MLRRCDDCGKYTLNVNVCPYCGGMVHIPHPSKFSLNDKYLKYRIRGKKKEID